MTFEGRLERLGSAARRLNDGSHRINQLLARIDDLLGRMMLGLDYVHPRPLEERVTLGRDGKRVTELAYLGYLKVQGNYHLAVKTVKVLETRAQAATHEPGTVEPLVSAPRRLRHAAIDQLPALVTELANQVDEVLRAMERRCASAEALVDHLERVAEDERPTAAPARSEARRPRKTQPLGPFE
jgi:hypothetical protein